MLLSRMDFRSPGSVPLGRNAFGPGRFTASAVASGSPSSSDLRNKPSTTRSELTTTQVSEPAARTRDRTPPIRSVRPQVRSEEHTSELQSRPHLVCRLLLEKKKKKIKEANKSDKQQSYHRKTAQ